MPSRMERYADIKLTRTAKNRDLYEEIYENKEYSENKRYSNVEGVVETPVTGNIDIERIKKIINNREENSKLSQKRVRKMIETETSIEEDDELSKNYDIKDVLNKAKDERPNESADYHSLKNIDFNTLKKVASKVKSDESESELQELIDTITCTSKLNKIGDKELSLDLLDDLKSTNNTFIGGSDAIRNILNDAKKSQHEETEEMDKSFYTKSMNLTEDLEGLSLKKGNNKNLIKIFIIISIIVFIIVGIAIIFAIIK